MSGKRACDEADLLPTKRRLAGANDESTRQKWRRFLAICAKNVVPDGNAATASPDHAANRAVPFITGIVAPVTETTAMRRRRPSSS